MTTIVVNLIVGTTSPKCGPAMGYEILIPNLPLHHNKNLYKEQVVGSVFVPCC